MNKKWIIHSAPIPGGSMWVLGVSAVAVMLWLSLFLAHPAVKEGGFDLGHAATAAWPDSPVFTWQDAPAPTFYDGRVILYALEQVRQGRDPYEASGRSASGYLFNYPSIWLWLAGSGLAVEHVRVCALVLAAAYLTGLIVLLRPDGAVAAAVTVACMLGLPSLGVMANANNEMVIFLLVVAAGELWRHPRVGWLAGVAVVVAAMLKLYPWAALAAFVTDRKRGIWMTIAGLSFLGVWWVLHAEELRAVMANTPRPHVYAFGSQVLVMRLQASIGSAAWLDVLPMLSSVLLVGMLAGVGIQGWRHSSKDTVHDGPLGRERLLFRMGAAMHLFYFFIGSNWLHREIMWTLLLPWCLARARLRWLAGWVVGLFWVQCWTAGPVFLAVQLATWMLTARLGYELARDLAPGLRELQMTWFFRRSSRRTK
jgi:hypothetical protein